MAEMMGKSLSSNVGNQYKLTTEEVMAMFPSRKQEKEISSKCLVYTLVVIVAMLLVSIVFACIVLRVGDPQIQLKSARLVHDHNTKLVSSLNFNVTIVARLSLTNPNFFCGFYYENSTLIMLYGASRVAAFELKPAKLDARETKEMELKLHMMFGKKLLLDIPSRSTVSAMLKLTSYAKLSGTVHVLNNMLKKTETIEMACLINLNFTSYSTQHFQC